MTRVKNQNRLQNGNNDDGQEAQIPALYAFYIACHHQGAIKINNF